jgi:hypothetical protein
MKTKTILTEMPHVGVVDCPYCAFKFYVDPKYELFPLEQEEKRMLFGQYLKYKRISLPCPECHKDIVFDSNLHKTFKYDELIDKVSPNMAEYLKNVKFYAAEFVKKDNPSAVQPVEEQHKQTNLSFKTFSEVLDENS